MVDIKCGDFDARCLVDNALCNIAGENYDTIW